MNVICAFRAAVTAALLLVAVPAVASTFFLDRTIDHPTGVGGDAFGWSISADGNRVLIGSPAGLVFDRPGRAYLHDITTGALLQSFTDPNPKPTRHRPLFGYSTFGYSVALSGERALIGSGGSGAVYLYDTTTGVLLQTFSDPSPPPYGRMFGDSLALSGDRALIGTWNHESFLFDTSTGALLHTFTGGSVGLGYVALSDDRALIGGASASAKLYSTTTGTLLQTFNNPEPVDELWFGFSVALAGDRALIGVYDDGFGAGAAHLFDTITGSLLHSFYNPSPTPGDTFGWSVALSEEWALIGAPFDNTGAKVAGSAFLYDTATGALLQSFRNPAPGLYRTYGHAVAISDRKVLIGAPDNWYFAYPGSVLVHAVPLPAALPLLLGALGALGALALMRRRRAG